MRELKQPIREFMQNHYSDERLAALLAHARDGKLSYMSCCCFIGCSNADHALIGGYFSDDTISGSPLHLFDARILPGAFEAEKAYNQLWIKGAFPVDRDAKRRRILIPMIRAEMKRREHIRQQSEWKQELVEMST